jgi:hypothetical protein
MKNIILILSVFLLFGCNDNKNLGEIQFDDESTKLIDDGISVDAAQHEIILRCYATSTNMVEVKNILQESNQSQWLSVNIQNISDKEYVIKIVTSKNQEANTRKGSFDIYSDNRHFTVSVTQAGENIISVNKTNIVVSNTASSVDIKCISHQAISLRVVSDIPAWLSTEMEKSGDNDSYVVRLNINKNNDLGRIAKIVIESADGASCQVCIRQQPRLLSDTETLTMDKMGTLDVLLGDDVENIRNIRQLSISGSLNGCDLNAIRRLFINQTEKGYLSFPVALDLKKCTLYGNLDNYYKDYGLELTTNNIGRFDDRELPDGFLTNAANLTEVSLPENTESIGKKSLANCVSLSSIKIPDDTKYIKYGAFQGCKRLENIQLGKESGLLEIDGYAFNTGCKINVLSLPACLSSISREAFAASSIRELYVSWAVPPIIYVLPNPVNCTLYVPRGSKEKYQSTDNWNRFVDIKEFSLSD